MDINPSTNKTKLIGHLLTWGGLALSLLIGNLSYFTKNFVDITDPQPHLIGGGFGVLGVILHFYGLYLRIGPDGGLFKYIKGLLLTLGAMVAIPIGLLIIGIGLAMANIDVSWFVFIVYFGEIGLAISLLVWVILANIHAFRLEARKEAA